jgi:hypothetical protein
LAIDVDAEFGDLLALIYDAALDWTRWPDALTRLADEIGAHHVSLGIYDAATQAFAADAPRTDPDYTKNLDHRVGDRRRCDATAA